MSRKKLRIMPITGHPADAFQRCGGALAKHIKAGDEAHILSLSYGERGEAEALWQKGMDIDEIKRVKDKEAQDAAKILGCSIECLDFGDNPILIDWNRQLKIADAIRGFKPDIVITHFLGDPYEDHVTTNRTVMACLSFLGFYHHRGIPDERALKNPPHNVAATYFMEPSRGTAEIGGWKPSFYVDITDVVDIKRKAMDVMESQNIFRGKREPLSHYFADLCNEWRGYACGVQYAEGYAARTHQAFKLFPYVYSL